MNKGLYTSNKKDWETPKNLFEELNKKYKFTVDLCASEENKLCEKFYSEKNSCLDKKIENEVIYCNPPYGREIGKFVKKCYELSRKNKVIMLLPARTDTNWFHDYVYNKAEIEFVKGRLKFSNSKNSAPFPSMIIKY